MPKKVSTKISVAIGMNVRKIRKSTKLTQLDLAKKMKLSMQQIQKYESGLTSMSIERLFEVAELLNVDINEIIKIDLSQAKKSDFANEAIKFIKIIDSQADEAEKSEVFEYIFRHTYNSLQNKKEGNS